MDTKELCLTLADSFGVPGMESDTARLSGEILGRYMSVSTDRLGNVLGRKEGKGKHILLDAHMDRIGFIVRGIDEKGFVLFDKCGGIDVRTLIGNEVEIFAKEKLFGVICSTPPHLSDGDKKLPEISKIAIDIGMSRDEALKLISPGDRGIIRNKPCTLLGDKIASAALDNRAGMAVLIKTVEYLEEKGFDANLTVMFSVQEEVGRRGARTGAFVSQPDETIVVDVSFGYAPGLTKDSSGELGKGPMIGFAAILDRGMTKELVRVAEENGISYQSEAMSRTTGTNADFIPLTASGIRTALVSVPLRSMHTTVEVVSISDIENTAKLIGEYIIAQEGK